MHEGEIWNLQQTTSTAAEKDETNIRDDIIMVCTYFHQKPHHYQHRSQPIYPLFVSVKLDLV